jgi:hypothetical protein
MVPGFLRVVIWAAFDGEFDLRGRRACGLHRIEFLLFLRFGRRSWVDHGDEIESKLDRFGVLWDVSGGRELCFLMAYKKFKVP